MVSLKGRLMARGYKLSRSAQEHRQTGPTVCQLFPQNAARVRSTRRMQIEYHYSQCQAETRCDL